MNNKTLQNPRKTKQKMKSQYLHWDTWKRNKRVLKEETPGIAFLLLRYYNGNIFFFQVQRYSLLLTSHSSILFDFLTSNDGLIRPETYGDCTTIIWCLVHFFFKNKLLTVESGFWNQIYCAAKQRTWLPSQMLTGLIGGAIMFGFGEGKRATDGLERIRRIHRFFLPFFNGFT